MWLHLKRVSLGPPALDKHSDPISSDGHARDVTVRYAKNFASKTVKLRVPARKDKEDWWERVMNMLQRPYRLVRSSL
jgi:xeroderma pigmentosum group C-complementing protein